jgi:hypothetical protein
MQHLEEGTIHAWLDGALSGDEAAGVEAHVRQCAQCAAAVGEARGLIAGASRIVSALDVVPGGVIPRPKPTTASVAASPKSLWRVLHFTPLRAAIAATLLVAVGSLLVPRGDKRTPILTATVDTAVSDAVAATAAAPAPMSASARVLPSSAPPPQAQATVGARSRPSVAKVAEQKLESRTANAPVAEKAMADAAGFVARDSARPVVADSTRVIETRAMAAAGASADVSRRDAARSAPVRLLNQAEPLTLTGCFRAAEDPARLGIALPQRFSLERDTTRNVLRRLDDAGRVESAVGGWRQVNATSVLITLETRDQRGIVLLTRDVSGVLTARSSDLSAISPSAPGVASRSVSVSRMDCGR